MLSDSQRAALAARLRQGRRATVAVDDGPVVPLSSTGTVPVFVVHAVGGSVYEYAPLVRELAGTCRMYGIEAAGLRAGTTPVDSLAAMADRYAEAVRATQPDGPYRLIGWSMGGVLAFETARRVEASGGRVALVALIDTPSLTMRSYAESERGLAALFVTDVRRTAGRPAESSGPGSSAALPVADQLDLLAADLVADPTERATMAAELLRRYAVFAAHTTALASYAPAHPLDAAGVLVTAHGSRDSAPAWTPMFRGGVRALSTPADHYGCLRPPAIGAIAAAISAAL